MNKIIIPTLLVILLVILLDNSSVYCSTKPTPYSFLNNAISTRSAGLAGASVCFDYDAAGTFINPALLSIRNSNNINVTFLKHLLDINSGNLFYVLKDSTYGTFAASAIYTNFGTFPYYDEYGNELGNSFTGNLIALNGSFATQIDEHLHGGVTLKLIFNQLESMNGFAIAVDAGLLYKLPDNRTNLGFSILNAGTELKKFAKPESSEIPLDIRLGFNHRLQGLPLNFNFGFNHLATGEKFFSRFGNVNIGGELYFGDYVQIRIGYDNYISKNFSAAQNKGFTGLAAGAGILTEYLNIDYAISIYSAGLYLHRFGVNFKL
jgi:hypothetical protein